MRHFDVAPHYGLGLAERRLGAALVGRPRDEYVLSTKVGRILRPSPETAGRSDDMGFAVAADTARIWDASERGIRVSLEDSLERLGVDRIDILYLHDPEEHGLEESLATALPALTRLREEGLVTAVGVGSKSVEALRASVATGLIDVVMVAGRYTLLEQPALPLLLPECSAAGVEVVDVGVYNSGALSRRVPRSDLTYEYAAMPEAVFDRLRHLAEVCSNHGVELPAAALQFPLRHEAVTSIVIGARTADEVAQNVERFVTDIPEGLWADLRDRGLIP
ncbi:aldo/keto reductase [Frondihabitans sucicola]|uniref:aldo/keto reductase n=1 Tax=Frondihabitans sucicola TaxID=1268041 RepID=UPI0033057EB9